MSQGACSSSAPVVTGSIYTSQFGKNRVGEDGHSLSGCERLFAQSAAGEVAARPSVRVKCASIATNVTAQAASATQLSSAPMASTIGRWSDRPKLAPADAVHAERDTTLHSIASSRKGMQ